MAKAALFRRLAWFVAAGLVLAACSTDSNPGEKTATAAEARAPEEAVTAQATSDSAPVVARDTTADPPGTGSEEYRILPHDIIEVSVFQVPDLNKAVRVGDDGNINLPLVGKVKVAGKTAHDAEVVIADGLRKKYLQSPQVGVSVKQYGQKVTVSGAVKAPHVLAADGSVTLSQAVALSGGLAETANPQRVHIARVVDRHVQDEIYDLDAIQSGRTADPIMQAGDIVVAEESGAKVAFKNLKDMLPFAVLASIL